MKQDGFVKALGIGFIVLLILNIFSIYLLVIVNDENNRLGNEIDVISNTDVATIKVEKEITGGGSNPDPNGGTAHIIVNITNKIDKSIAPNSIVILCRSYYENGNLYDETVFQIETIVLAGTSIEEDGYLWVGAEFSGSIGIEIFAFYKGEEIFHQQYSGLHY